MTKSTPHDFAAFDISSCVSGGPVDAPTQQTETNASIAPEGASGPIRDVTFYLWRDFADARSCAQKLTHRQQAIETAMVECVGLPVAQRPTCALDLVSAVGPGKVIGTSGGSPDQTNLGERQRASYQDQCARWSAADAELGYSAALRAEGRALRRVRELAEHLWATPAASLTGVIAKLDALLSEGAPSSEAQEFPWPQLRAIRADLEFLRLNQPRTPGR
ncbi:MAG: hypothetical protein ACP5QR_17070 [Rhizomicrobium sp.]